MFTVRIAPTEQLGSIDVLDRVEDIRFDLRVVCRERRDQLDVYKRQVSAQSQAADLLFPVRGTGIGASQDDH